MPSADVDAPRPKAALVAQVLLGCFVVLYVVSFVSYAVLDSAPRPWDEAFFLLLPSKLLAADGPLAVVSEYYSARFHKPPISMLGTTLSMAAFGSDALGYRLDNLAVALLGAFIAFRLLARVMPRDLAATLCACMLASPFALQFVRIEFAEIYIWTCTIVFYALALGGRPFASRRGACVLGLAAGAGMLSKLSFPLIAGPVALWSFGRELGAAAGTRKQVLYRAGGAVAVCVAVVAAGCGKNWKHIWRNLRAQYGWVGDELGGAHDRMDLAFLGRYLSEWIEYVGPLWIGLAALGLVTALRARRHRDAAVTALRASSLVAPLFLSFLVNLGFCYFFPLTGPRFTIGAIVSFTLLASIGAGLALRTPAIGSLARIVLLAVALLFLVANTYLPARHPQPLIRSRLPVIGTLRHVLPPPNQDPDHRAAAIAAVPGEPQRLGLAGDHRSFNIDNLRLWSLANGRAELDFVQVAYLGRGLAAGERIAKAGRVDGWIICLTPRDQESQLWSSRHARPVRDALAKTGGWRKADWLGQLPDGTRVVVYVPAER